MFWWVDLGYPPFEQGKGGFPRTGQVVRHYRKKKRDDGGEALTQRGLAKVLEITEKAIRDIENRDAGLDFERRQRLSQCLDIPPILLGIRTHEEILKRVEQERGKIAAPVVSPSVPPSPSWWVELGYPPFAPGKESFFPRTGRVVKHYREQKMDEKRKPWTQRLLAQALDVTEQAVRDLENKDSGMDFERRQFLSKLFDIPPILLGIITLDEIDKIVEQRRKAKSGIVIVSTPAATSHKLTIDVQEYTALLNSYWTTYISNPTQVSMTNIGLCMDALYRELPHMRDQKTLQELLCRFHDLTANILWDQQEYNDALVHLEKAWRFAQLLSKDELKAAILYDYGFILWRADRLDEALKKYEQARRYERNLPNNLRGSLLLQTGSTAAQVAETQEKKEAAIALVDQVGKIVRSKEVEEDPYFLNLNLDYYHLKRSASLIAVGRNRDAIDELELVEFGPERPRRQAYHNILQAQVQFNLGEYSEAAHFAASGLVIAQESDSKVNIARVKHMYKQFPQDLFKHDADVARLEYLLRYKHRAR